MSIAVPLIASDAVLSNGQIDLVFPAEGEVLLKQIIHTARGIKNLREIQTDGGFLPFATADNEAGLRMSIDGENFLRWKIAEQKPDAVTLIDESGSVEARFHLPPDSVAIGVTFVVRQPVERFRLLFHLEVGGGFLGVPTEGPDDRQIVPIRASADAPIQISTSEIPRESTARYELAVPWWAVADQNNNFLLACLAETLPVSVEQKSQPVGTSDTLLQIMEFPLKKNETTMQLFLFDGLSGLSGLTPTAAFWILRNKDTVRLLCAPSKPLAAGQIILRSQGKTLGEFSIENWMPGKIITHDLDVSEWNFSNPVEIEMHGNGSQQHATLFPEK